eukprot:scaffold15878_cov67-Attheya_sp.AAC.3
MNKKVTLYGTSMTRLSFGLKLSMTQKAEVCTPDRQIGLDQYCVCVNRPPQTQQLVLNNRWWYSNPSRGTEIATRLWFLTATYPW